MNKLQKKVLASILGVTAMATVSTSAHAIDVASLGTLAGAGLTANANLLPYGWDGFNNGSFGWMHNSDWVTFSVSQAGQANVSLSRTNSPANATSPAFTIWSYSGNPDWTSYDMSVNDAMDYDQLTGKTGSTNSDWLPLTGLVGYANAGTGFVNNHGSSLLHTSASSSVAQAIFNFAPGNYLMVMGGSCSTGTCASAGAQAATLSITPAAVPVPGAVWLFGSAMAGLIGFGKRKSNV